MPPPFRSPAPVPLRAPRRRPLVRRSLVAVAVVTAAATLTAGCGVRLETPPPPVVTLDAAEQVRAGAVVDAEAIAAAATAAAADPAAASVLDRLTQVATASASHVEALGGTWTAPEGQEPTDGPTAPAATTDLAGALATLQLGYDDARAGLGEVSDGTSRLLVSVALWRAIAAHEIAAASGAATATPLPVGGVDTTALGLASFRDVDPLVRGLDAAAFGYEVLAAGSDDAARRSDWGSRAGELRRTGDLLASRAGATGASDPREAVYDVASLLDADPVSAAVTLETEVARLWVGAALPGATRGVALDAALEALLRARALAPVGALDDPAVVLPGLTGEVPSAG
ncbi:hypothetical protein [Serinibacter arcticus]|uniref:hypothetical protein n=1 Tax=Serinibacter arcticus TaxID=1655435 RepID=UPI0011B1F346|nr:hypothetical protein [Serinibacter arcticus]